MTNTSILSAAATLDTIPATAATTNTISPGQSVIGTIDQDDVSGNVVDSDWYKVTLIGGHRYTFSANANVSTSDTLDSIFVRLRDANGNPLVPDFFAEGPAVSADAVVPGSGSQVYYIAISAGGTGFADKTGQYQMALTDQGVATTYTLSPATVTVNEFAGTVSFTITRTGILVQETVYASTTQTEGYSNNGDYQGLNNLTVDFAANQAQATVTVSIIDDSLAETSERFGLILQRSSTDPITTFVAKSTFTILDNDTDTVRQDTTTTATIAAGQTISGSIEQNDLSGDTVDHDWYKISLSAGHTYHFQASANVIGSDTLDAVAIDLKNSTGSTLTGVFDGATPSFDYTPTSSSTYYVAISAGGSGAFQDKTGGYQIGVSDNGVSVVDTIRRDTATTATLTAGQAQNGSIDQNDLSGNSIDADWYKVTLTAGHSYHFSASSNVSLSDPLDAVAIDLKDSNGGTLTSIADGAAPSFDFQATTTGTYFLSISAGGSGAFQDKSGTYQISYSDNGSTAVDTIAETIATTASLTPGQPIVGMIDQNDLSGDLTDKDYYKLTLTSGHQYTLSADANVSLSDTLDSIFIRVRDANGNPLSTDLFAEGNSVAFTSSTIPGTGDQTYYIAVSAGGSGFADKTGQYNINLTDLGASRPTYSVSLDQSVVNESAGTITFTITRSGSILPAETIYASTVQNLNGNGVLNNNDYASNIVNSPLTFAVGETTKTLTLSIINDAISEHGETFGFIVQQNANDPLSTTLAKTTFTIQDDDIGAVTKYHVVADDRTVTDVAGTTIHFTVTRSGDLPAETVYASTLAGVAGWSDNTGLFNSLAGQVVTFAAGATTATTPLSLTLTGNPLSQAVADFGLIVQKAVGSITDFVAQTNFSLAPNVAQAAELNGPHTILLPYSEPNIRVFQDFGEGSAAGDIFSHTTAGNDHGKTTGAAADVYLHYAIDFGLVVGTAVLSQGEGQVIASRNTIEDTDQTVGDGIGNYITIKYGTGANAYFATYMHLEKEDMLAVDSYVAVGTLLGRSGQTGTYYDSDGSGARFHPHLHVTYGIDKVSVEYSQGNITMADGSLATNGASPPVLFKDANVGDSGQLSDDPNKLYSGDNFGICTPTDAASQGQTIGNGPNSTLTVIGETGTGTKLEVAAIDNQLVVTNTQTNEVIVQAIQFGKLAINSVTDAVLRALEGSGILPHTVYFNGTNADDRLDGSGTDTSVVAAGGMGKDTLLGGSANDLLDGNSGNDTISGGAGNDLLNGGHIGAPAHIILNDDTLWSQGAVTVSNSFIGNGGTVSYYASVDLNGFSFTNLNRTDFVLTSIDQGFASTNNYFFDGAHIFDVPSGGTVSTGDTIRIKPDSGGTFSVQSIDLDTLANWTGVKVTFTGVKVDGSVISQTFTLDSLQGMQSFQFGQGFTGLSQLDFAPDTNVFFDNLALTQTPTDNDKIDGGAGVDTVDYSSSNSSVSVNLSLSSNQATGTDIGADQISNVENIIGSNSNDILTGNAGNNVIEGLGGNDILNGGGGTDTASYEHTGIGVTVNLSISGAQNTLGAGTDTITGFGNLIGSAFNDKLTGNSGINTLTGLGGNDTLDGGTGADIMIGGTGDDTYVVDNAGDVVDETTGDGTDTVLSSISFSLADSVHAKGDIENLTLTGSTAINATGNGLDNTIIGNSGNNILAGLGGADHLDGGAGTGDTATYLASLAGVTVSLMTGLGSGGDAQGDTLVNIENLTGSNSDDTLEGSSGNNILAGGLNGVGGDTVSYEHAGASVTVNLSTTTAQNTLGAGTDTLTGFENLIGSAFNDKLTGNSGNNVITGLAGNDTLDGGAGADTMIGGTGNDTYVVDNVGDVVDETGGDGTDTIQSSIAFSLLDGVHAIGLIENLTLTGTTAINATGNDLNNIITGNSGINTLTGLGGNDTLDGGTGADIMIGGTGDDTYVVDNAGDVVDETTGDGTDTVLSSISFSLADSVHAKGDIENLTLTGSTAINATGNGLDNTIIGNSGNNILAGLGGADHLDGGAGTGDTATYLASLAGVTVSLMTGLGSGGDAQGDTLVNIENLTGSNSDDTLEGSSGNNILAGGLNGVGGDTVSYEHAGASVTVNLSTTTAQNTLGAGTDTLTGFENLIGSAFNDKLTGNSGNNVITGLAGNDTLDGGAGADTMIGGTGNDTYVVDNVGDVVDETGGDGTDTIQSSIAFSLLDGVHAIGLIENLTLTGTTAINATGNDLNNIITGNSGINTLTGLGGNDTLDGGTGADIMIGGTGDDTYVVDNAGDVVDETTGDGTDTVLSSISFSLADSVHAKGDIENLTLTGSTAINATGNGLDNTIIGNSGNNILAGLGGADHLDGGAGTGDTATYLASLAGVTVSLMTGLGSGGDAQGDTLVNIENLTGSNSDDTLEGSSGNNILAGGLNGVGGDTVSYEHAGASVTVNLSTTTAQNTLGAGTDTLTGFENLIGSAFNDKLTGNSGNNVITGLAGNDTLDGGAGADTMIGGTGNDTYVVDNVGDVVDETGGDGTDTIQSSIAFSLLDGVHAIGLIENLTLTGTTAINATGNDLNNIITGNSGINTLTGLGGNDTLDGGTGADIMIGGTGDDTYVVDNAGDVVDETTGDGTDTVLSSISFSLADSVHAKGDIENLTLTGSTAINATGNGLDNTIIGNSGNNILAGLGGADHLDGGAGTGDTATYLASLAGVTVSLMTGLGSGGDAQGDTLVNIENLTGSNSDDTLEGSSGNNILAGGLNGVGGDTVSYEHAGASVTVNLSTTTAQNTLGAGTDTLTGFENLIGSAFNDKLTGNSGNNVITGLAGNDTMTGGGGNDTFYFAAGFGKDIITDFTVGAATSHDTLHLALGVSFDTYAEVMASATQIGSDTVITIDANDTITLQGVLKSALVTDDFLFG